MKIKKEYTEKDFKKMQKKIHKMMKHLNGKEVPYNENTKCLLYTKNNQDMVTPLCEISKSRTVKKLKHNFNPIGKDTYSYEDVERIDSLLIEYDKEVVDNLITDHIPHVYKALKSLKVYIYIPESLRVFWDTAAEWQPLSLQWAL